MYQKIHGYKHMVLTSASGLHLSLSFPALILSHTAYTNTNHIFAI